MCNYLFSSYLKRTSPIRFVQNTRSKVYDQVRNHASNDISCQTQEHLEINESKKMLTKITRSGIRKFMGYHQAILFSYLSWRVDQI